MNENFTSILQKDYKISYRIKGGLEKVHVTKIPKEGEEEPEPQSLEVKLSLFPIYSIMYTNNCYTALNMVHLVCQFKI